MIRSKRKSRREIRRPFGWDSVRLFGVDGILNVDKPAGPSSAAVVNKIKHLLPHKMKIGHAGTLDPFATGVLIVLIGKATRLSESLMDQPKSYLTTVKLGATTATDDLKSPEIISAVSTVPSDEAIDAAIARLTGDVMQRPPAYSAMKIGGRRAYKLARSGKPVELAPRRVRIDRIEVIKREGPFLELEIDCGRGTYIRSIARELGELLGVGGYLTQLRRTRVGAFLAAEAISPQIMAEQGVEKYLVPIPAGPLPIPPSITL